MDFSVAGSDVWESTPTQEHFIESYFHHGKEHLSGKKKEMVAPDKILANQNPARTRKPKKSKLVKKSQFKLSKHLECPIEDSMASPTKKLKLDHKTKLKASKQLECSINESIPSPTKKLRLNKKNKLKSTKHLESPIEDSVPSPTKKLKLKKENKLKSSKHLESPIEDYVPSSTKKLKLTKNSKLKSNKHLESPIEKSMPCPTKKLKNKSCKEKRSDVQLETFLEDESDDEQIISDIKNSSIFKEIQKFMKETPNLQNMRDSDDTEREVSGSSSDSDTSESNLIENPPISPRSVKSCDVPHTLLKNSSGSASNFPTSVKSCDFPRTLLENSSGDSKKDNLGKNKERLQGAKFRHLNEKLYTESGENAFKYFQENQEEYYDYHKGYNVQVSKWPMNPVDKILSDLEDIEDGAVIADMGCGDAKIARTLTNSTVHSFDIVALNGHVTPCNISKVPLAKESVDIVVFCLSLMGTNLKEYLLEAHRILKLGGTLKIAEVESRIEDVNVFIKKLKLLGFSIKEKDLKHRMFVFLDFKKVTKKLKKDKIPSLALKPCLYKKR